MSYLLSIYIPYLIFYIYLFISEEEILLKYKAIIFFISKILQIAVNKNILYKCYIFCFLFDSWNKIVHDVILLTENDLTIIQILKKNGFV